MALNRSKYLQALGMFTLARRHAERANELCIELASILEIEPNSHVEDAVWSTKGGTPADFDEALKREGVDVD